MEANSTPDLFDVLLTAYKKARQDGEVRLPGGAVLVQDQGRPDTAEEFADFSRRYLVANPIRGQGSSLGTYGVILADGAHVAIVNPAAFVFKQHPNVVYPYTGEGQGGDLPPAHTIQTAAVAQLKNSSGGATIK